MARNESKPPAAADNKVCVARIGAAHGVRGEVKFWSFTEDPQAVADDHMLPFVPISTGCALARSANAASARASGANDTHNTASQP